MNRRSFLRAAAGIAAAFGLGPLMKAGAIPAAKAIAGTARRIPQLGDPCPFAGVRCAGHTDNGGGTITIHFVADMSEIRRSLEALRAE